MKRMIFLNIGWMKEYKGITAGDDSIIGGGSFVQEHGFGYEIFNFLPHDGYMYGYVQVKGSISIERLGGAKNDVSINNVLAIWVAKSPSGGVFIVGWYDHATIYRNLQPPPENLERIYNGERFGHHFVKAREEDCLLLPMDKRTCKIPRRVKGGMGQANIWYADTPEMDSFRKKVLDFVNAGGNLKRNKLNQTDGTSRQPDPYKRQRVERIAIKLTTEHYENLGYSVDSVEKDNMGWDLEATVSDKRLRLEVKGLSQAKLLVELTPNEYANMKKYKDSYRLCVVTNALSKSPLLRVFSYSPENGRWEDDKGKHLQIRETISAQMSML